MTELNEQQTSAWDRYWQDGRGAACQADERGFYQGVIASTWSRLFTTLPAGCRLLDLATGNGAVPALAAELLSPGQFPVEIHGVDSARIRPMLEQQPAGGIRFRWHPRTRNESLPFAAGMFDGVVSQYGVEYGDLQRTVSEVGRILRADGWLQWVCHWRDGDIARDAADEAERAGRLRALSLPARISALVKRQQRNGCYIPNSHQRTWHLAEAVRVKHGLAEGFDIARSTPTQPVGNLGLFLHNLAHLYQHREQHPVEEMLERMARCDEELLAHQQRLEAQVRAALTNERVDQLKMWLSEFGLELITRKQLCEPSTGRVVGMLLQAARGRGHTVLAEAVAAERPNNA
ncbi:MAG: class I SAM-dependent methyltransferase [Wenzhouxiangella sp.]